MDDSTFEFVLDVNPLPVLTIALEEDCVTFKSFEDRAFAIAAVALLLPPSFVEE